MNLVGEKKEKNEIYDLNCSHKDNILIEFLKAFYSILISKFER